MMSKSRAMAMLLFAGGTLSLHAQAAKLPSSFDVVSVRVNNSGLRTVMINAEKNSFTATNVTLITMLDMAYGMKSDQISGAPGWVDSTHFDIQAKVLDAEGVDLDALTDKELQPILQTLLAERFQLKTHTETKTLPVYELVVAKGGAKLKLTPATAVDGKEMPREGMITVHRGDLSGSGMTMARLSSLLGDAVRRTVIDRTGMTGGYDIMLRWTPEGDASSAGDSGAADAPPPIFTAVQEQLGLKLQAGRGPVATLVVDHVEKPSEN